MRILVTGGAGFIGTNYVYHAVKQGHEVTVLDKLTYAGGRDNLAPLGDKVKLIVGDVADPAAVSTAMKGVERVIHFAAESHNTRSETDPDLFYRTNVEGTRVMLEAAQEAKVKRFLQISCYDEVTRAFTKDGLKQYWELAPGDEVLTINPESSVIEWQPIHNVIVQDYEGPMVKIAGRRIDLLVTPNHRMLVETCRGHKIKVIEAEHLLRRAVSIIPRGLWSASDDSERSQAFFYLLGIFIGDGFLGYQERVSDNKTGLARHEWLERARGAGGKWEVVGRVGLATKVVQRSYRIFIDIPERDGARKKVERALDSLGYAWHAQRGKSGEHIYLTAKNLYHYFQDCGHGARNKRIPRWGLESSREALKAILEGLVDSDGRWQSGGGAVITTASHGLTLDIAEICAKLGYSSSVKKYRNASIIDGRRVEGDAYIVSFGVTSRRIVRGNASPQKYKGKIWCVSVPPNRNLLVERNGKFVFCGNTDEVYGSKENGYFKEADKQLGDGQATSAYSKSKSLADDLALEYADRGLPVVVTRTTNNFGPWQYPEKALPRWITNVLNGDKIPLWGEGRQVRDWLYAPVNAEAIDFVLEHGVIGEAYNVAANHHPEITNRDVAEQVCALLKRGPAETIELIPDPRPNHDFRYALDTTKLQQLGWTMPKQDFADQLAATVRWYVDHRAWWQQRKAEAEKIY